MHLIPIISMVPAIDDLLKSKLKVGPIANLVGDLEHKHWH